MPEVTVTDREMVVGKISPDGPVDGAPIWEVVSGDGTLITSPDGLSPEAQALWDPSLPEGFQCYLVSPTLAETEFGPVPAVFQCVADVAHGAEVQTLMETFTLQVVNHTTSLSGQFSGAVAKP